MAKKKKKKPLGPPTWCFNELKQRDWTPLLVRNFLGEPLILKANPRYRSAAPMRLYAQKQVKKIEKQIDWQTARAVAAARSTKGKAAAERRAQALLAQAKTIHIVVHPLPKKELLYASLEHYNSRQEQLSYERDWFKWSHADEGAPPNFLERIQVNFLRHQRTFYDSILVRLFAKSGGPRARLIVTQRIFEAIEALHPWLAAECRRQLREKQNSEPAHLRQMDL